MQSIYERIGLTGTLDVILSATPVYALPLTPLTFFAYRRILSESSTITQLEEMHGNEIQISAVYSFARPLFRHAAPKLRRDYAIR